jgi:hypothetical protein
MRLEEKMGKSAYSTKREIMDVWNMEIIKSSFN